MTMRAPWLSLALLAAAILAGPAGEPFSVQLRQLKAQENGIITAAWVEANGLKYSVVVPPGWKARSSVPEQSLTLTSLRGESPITIRFASVNPSVVLASSESIRQHVVPYLSQAVLLEEFPAHSGCGTGRGIDLTFTTQGQRMKARVAVIPLAQALASFTLTTPAGEWESSLRVFGITLTSFQPATNIASDFVLLEEPMARPAKVERPAARLAATAAAQQVEVLRTEPPPPSPLPTAPAALFAGREETVKLSLLGALTVLLLYVTLSRFRREAEIRALSGGYLSDGTEAAKYVLPAWFAPQSALAEEGAAFPHQRMDWVGASEAEQSEPDRVGEFLLRSPELLGSIRTALRDLGRAHGEAEWHSALTALPQQIRALKDLANFWEMRPVWQMSSALELLAQRVAEKPKEATPSTLRTFIAATDLLQTLCARGIRPNLIIEPPIRLMAADDDPLCLRAITFALGKAGLTPDLAENGREALGLALKNTYDVIFMDIEMPEMDGLTACAKIRETSLNARTPVVFVTVKSDFQTRAQSNIIGGSDLMAKPFLVFEMTVKSLMFTMRRRLELLQETSPALLPVAPSAPLDRVALAQQLSAQAAEGAAPEQPRFDLPLESEPLQAAMESGDFIARAPDLLLAMGQALEDVCLARGEHARHEHLGDLYLRVHAFANQAGLAGLGITARVGNMLEALLKKIYENPAVATASTLNSAAHALALLQELCAPGLEQRLSLEEPVRMLVVDDEPLARRAIAGALQLAFAKPETADDGLPALELVKQRNYDVIFTDVQMPGLDGFTLCTQIRTSEFNHTTPVIFVTSLSDTAAREKATLSGGNDFIAKPCLPSEITLKAMTFVLRKKLFALHEAESAAPRPTAASLT